MSYCTSATCLAHRRGVYFNLIAQVWVHGDGWACDALVKCPVPASWPDY